MHFTIKGKFNKYWTATFQDIGKTIFTSCDWAIEVVAGGSEKENWEKLCGVWL